MRDDTIPQTVLFPDLFTKPLVATFDQQHASSDGGAVLLKAAHLGYGSIDGFARCLIDDRQSGNVGHTLEDLLAQCIFGLACGHPDANDADRLRAARTACTRTQVTGLRERLLKLGVHIVVSARRIVLHLQTSSPCLDAWRHIALALGARTG